MIARLLSAAQGILIPSGGGMGVVALLLSLAVGGGLGWTVNGWRLAAEISDIKADLNRAAADQTTAVLQIERAAQRRISDLEVAALAALEKVDATAAENRRLVAAAGGLRDPGRPAAGLSAKSAAARPAADPAAAARLSDEAAGFLLDLAAACDRAAIYAGTGHDYAREVIGSP